MGTIPPPKSCGLYLPGHEVHWIQGIHSNDPGEVPPVACRIVAGRDDGTILTTLLGEQIELWNHDPVRLRALLAERGVEGSYQEHWRLLRIPSEEGNYCIDVTAASNPKRRPCPSRPPRHETLLDQLAESGGFTMPASDMAVALERLGQKSAPGGSAG